MNARLRKEFLQLRPAWIGAVALVLMVVPMHAPSWSAYEVRETAKLVLYVLGLTFLGVASFGREFSHRTFQLLLSQPCERGRLWREKLGALGVAAISVWLAYWILDTVVSGFSGWVGAFGFAAAVAVTATGLWASLLLRQVVPAFCLTLLLPSLFVPMALPWMEAELPAWKMGAALGGILAYAGLGLMLGSCLLGRAQDRGSEGWALTLPAKRKSAPSVSRRHGPTTSLARKELRLQQVNLFCGLIAFGLLAVLAAVFFTFGQERALAGTETALVLAVLFFPMLTGAAAITEERKLGTETVQFGLPVTMRRQFWVKTAVALGCAWTLGVALPLAMHLGLVKGVGISFTGGELRPIGMGVNFLGAAGPLTHYALFAGSLALYASSLARTTPAALLGAALVIFPLGAPLALLVITGVFPRAVHSSLPLAIAAGLVFLTYWNYTRPAWQVRSAAVTAVRGALALAAGAAAVWLVLDVVGSRMLRNSLKEWEEAGLPTKFSDTYPPPGPREGNAALVLEQVISFDHSPRKNEYRLAGDQANEIEGLAGTLAEQIAQNEISSETVEELTDALQDPLVMKWISVGREAAGYPHFDAYLDYDLGFALLIPHVDGLRQLSRLLQAEAVLQAAQNKWADAYETLVVSLRIGEFLQDEPLLMSHLAQLAIRQEVFRTLELLLQAGEAVAENFVQAWEPVLDELEPIHLASATKRQHIAETLLLLRMLETGEFKPSMVIPSSSGAVAYDFLDSRLFRPLHKADVATYIRESQRGIALLNEVEAGRIDVESFREAEKERLRNLPWYALVTAQILPDWSARMLESGIVSETELRLARTGVAAHRYRSAHGAWPESLGDVVPEFLSAVPQDPFAEAPLRYVRDPQRVLLYSIGPNREDDGGNRFERPRAHEATDIVWVLKEE